MFKSFKIYIVLKMKLSMKEACWKNNVWNKTQNNYFTRCLYVFSKTFWKKSLVEYGRNCITFSIQLKRHSSKLRNKNKVLVLIWKKIPESFTFIHSMIFIYLLLFCKEFSRPEKPYCHVNTTLIYNTLKNITLFYMKLWGY